MRLGPRDAAPDRATNIANRARLRILLTNDMTKYRSSTEDSNPAAVDAELQPSSPDHVQHRSERRARRRDEDGDRGGEHEHPVEVVDDVFG